MADFLNNLKILSSNIKDFEKQLHFVFNPESEKNEPEKAAYIPQYLPSFLKPVSTILYVNHLKKTITSGNNHEQERKETCVPKSDIKLKNVLNSIGFRHSNNVNIDIQIISQLKEPAQLKQFPKTFKGKELKEYVDPTNMQIIEKFHSMLRMSNFPSKLELKLSKEDIENINPPNSKNDSKEKDFIEIYDFNEIPLSKEDLQNASTDFQNMFDCSEKELLEASNLFNCLT